MARPDFHSSMGFVTMTGFKHFIHPRLLILIFLILTVGCASLVSNTIMTPAVQPVCTLQPQATGEKIIRPTIESLPDAQAHSGETLLVSFSGGYVAFNNARVCGGDIVGYIYSDDLPTPEIIRRVIIRLDDRELAAVDCPGLKCEFEFMIPADASPGQHELVLVTPWRIETKFDIEIVE
jgi:hypothetical protein